METEAEEGADEETEREIRETDKEVLNKERNIILCEIFREFDSGG